MKIVKYYYGTPSFTEVVSYNGVTASIVSRTPNPRVTICGIYDHDTNMLSIGIARCSSKDLFIKKIGAKLAYDRAENNPIVKVSVMDHEKVSHVFFDQARLLEKRFETKNYIKF